MIWTLLFWKTKCFKSTVSWWLNKFDCNFKNASQKLSKASRLERVFLSKFFDKLFSKPQTSFKFNRLIACMTENVTKVHLVALKVSAVANRTDSSFKLTRFYLLNVWCLHFLRKKWNFFTNFIPYFWRWANYRHLKCVFTKHSIFQSLFIKKALFIHTTLT